MCCVHTCLCDGLEISLLMMIDNGEDERSCKSALWSEEAHPPQLMGHSSSSVCCLSTNYIRHLNCIKRLSYQHFASTDDSLHIGAADIICTVLCGLQNCSELKTEMWWARLVTPLVYNHFYPGFITPQTRPLNYPVIQLYDVSLFAFCAFSCLNFQVIWIAFAQTPYIRQNQSILAI